MKLKLEILLFVVLANLVFAQSIRPIAREIHDYHTKKVAFQPFQLFSIDNSGKNVEYQKAANDLLILKLDKIKLSKILSERPEAMEFTFPFENHELVLEMVKVDIYSPEFHIETNKRKVLDYQKGVFYRGIIKGDPSSVVAFSFFDGDVVGLASALNIGNVTLGKARNSDDFVVYNDQKLTGANPFICSADELMNNEKQKISFDPKNSNAPQKTNNCVRIYYEICYNPFVGNGSSVINTINWMSAIHNNVATLYANDGVKISMKSLFIWETKDPYIGGTTDYITAFNAYRPNFDGDLGHLINSPSEGSYAKLNSLCESYNYAYSAVNIAYANVPTYSWTTMVMTHEMGHSFGSLHTHSCVWNGNMTPIDWCGPTAMPQIIISEGLTCDPALLPENGGTIMSYCHLLTNIGINLSKGFGEQPGALIRETIDSKICLGADCSSACNSSITYFSVDNVLKNSVTVKLTDVSTANQWKYRVTLMDGTIVKSEQTSEKIFTIDNLLPGTFYLVEVGMICSPLYHYSKMILTENDWCGKTITDSGGITSNYGNSESWSKTFYPDSENQKVKITFQEIDLVDNNDFIVLRNGPSLDSPTFVGGSHITGTYIRGPFQSTHSTGAITLVFKSDEVNNGKGFRAQLSCANLTVEDLANSKNVLFYPNPVKNKFVLKDQKNILNVELYDASGKLLIRFDNDSLLKNTFDISQLRPGNYIIMIKTQKEILKQKLIKE